jgi:hypothetical protein
LQIHHHHQLDTSGASFFSHQSASTSANTTNMRMQSLLPALAVMASTAQAATNYLVNQCGWDVYFTQVGGKGPVGETKLLAAGHHDNVSQFFTGTGQ